MQNNLANHHRQSIRLKNYDYSQAGAYFITICTQNKACLLGEIAEGAMQLNPIGQMLVAEWQALPNQFPTIELDVYMVMPNHIHGIIITTVGATLVVAPDKSPLTKEAGTRPALTHQLPTIGDVVGAFKSRSTVEYIRGIKTHNWKAFNGRLWQRNYYEHIIRNEVALSGMREYITNNPMQWELDTENPANNKRA